MPPSIHTLLPWQSLADEGHQLIVLVRHGQTQWNTEGRFMGRADIPLNTTGAQQALALAELLSPIPLAAAWSSPRQRATQTAALLLAGRELPLRVDERLAELDQGELEGQRIADMLPRYPAFFSAWQEDPAHVRVPGGESMAHCQARGIAALREIAAATPPGPPALVVSHNMLIRAVLCDVLALPMRRFRDLDQRNTSFNLISLYNNTLQLHLRSAHPHLRD